MIRHRPSIGTWRRVAIALLVAAGFGPAPAAEPVGEIANGPPPATLRYHRVIVPEGRLDEVPLGGHRLVPVPLEEFEAATRGATATVSNPGPAPARLLDAARYRAMLGGEGRLEGTLAFDTADGVMPLEVALGSLPVDRASFEADGAEGEGLLFGRADGELGTLVTRPGRTVLRWTLPPVDGAGRYVLPLVPAIRSTVELALPAGLVPLVEGNLWTRQAVPVDGADSAPPRGGDVMTAPKPTRSTWRIDVGPIPALTFTLVADRETSPRAACWQSLLVGPRQVRLSAVIVPRGPWRSRVLPIEVDPRLVIETVAVGAGAHSPSRGETTWQRSGTILDVAIPESHLGTVESVTITAAAPLHHAATPADPTRSADVPRAIEWLPLVRLPAAAWAGGGVRVECEPGSALVDVALEQCVPVAEEKTAAWPLADPRPRSEGEVAAGPATAGTVARENALLAVEAQAADLRLGIAVAPSAAELDIARVTTVDVATARIVGRMICDVLVRSGAAFDVAGRIAPGWFIDSVEAVERRGDGSAPTADAEVLEKLEWRVVRDRVGDRLRIGFPTAATPQRGFVLRIVGHRAGIATEEPFACSDMDMVRLDGESDGMAVLALSSSAETTIELDRASSPPAAVPSRLDPLVGETAIRAWIPVDGQAFAATGNLLDRRPPVEADTRVRLTVRDDRLTESFAFACRPEGSALDAVVIHFSEPTDELLEWSLLPPAGADLTVRRIDPRTDRAAPGAGGESWLVEIQPPLRDEVNIRATRVVPFAGPVAVPLAWVEGSARQTGEVVVVNSGRRRPLVVNRRLHELPPSPPTGDDDLPKGTLADFAFTPAIGAGPAVTPAAEIVPGGRDRDEDARAWVWNEETTCWCHPTGVTEYETRFDIENHGRTSVSLTPPAAVVPRGVDIDGAPVSVSPDVATGALLVDLPTDRRFVRLVVRSEVEIPTGNGLWRVDLAGTGIDVPVLERTWQVLLAGGVDIVALPAGLQDIGAARPGWLERLLPLAVRDRHTAEQDRAAGESRLGTIDAGFRERSFMALFRRGQGAGILLIHSRWLWGATLAVFLLLVAVGVAVRRRVNRLLIGVVLAVAALWLPLPLDALARAGLCGLGGAVIVRWMLGQWRRSALTAALLCLVPGTVSARQAESPTPADTASAATPESLPVFIVPSIRPRDGAAEGPGGGGQTALVPEPLFRALSTVAAGKAAAHVRILSSRVVAHPGAVVPWSLLLEVDADAGSLLTLVQDGNAGWDTRLPRLDDLPVRPTADSNDRLLRIGFAAPGRHRLDLGLAVRPTRAGDLETALISLPPAPRAEVVVEGPLAATRGAASLLQVDSYDGDRRPVRAPRAGPDGADGAVFDVRRSDRVRLAWGEDGRTRIVDALPSVSSRNEVAWEDGACRVAASYEIDPGEQVVRGVVVRASPRLGEIVVADPTFVATPLGGGRFLVEPVSPRRGPLTLAAAFVMPLVDPVGSFELPEAWLESALSDTRTTVLAPGSDLVVKPTLPDDATPVSARGADAPAGQAWRTEIGRAGRAGELETGAKGAVGPGGGASAGGTGARIIVERRRQAPRGSQRMELEFTDDQSRLRLQARLDATNHPLVLIPIDLPPGCDVERVTLREERAASLPAPEAGQVDVRFTRDGEGRGVAVVQRPRAGTFTLDVVAHLHGPPPSEGRVPLLRVAIESGGALTVTWRAPPGWAAIVANELPPEGVGPAAAATGSIEVPADAAAPAYRIVDTRVEGRPMEEGPADGAGEAVPGDDAPATAALPSAGPRVEFAETRLAIDSRGRAWGVSRFDLVAAEPVIRIQLPTGMRMFDVFIDGRVANDAVPARTTIAENAWEVRLLDVGWPRSIVAVYHGDLVDGLELGGTLDILPPAIVGLPCRRSAWVLELPEGVAARPLRPAVEVDAEMMAGERRAAVEGLVPEFEQAIERASPADARRLEEFLTERRREAILPLPPAWSHVGERDRIAAAAWGPPVRLLQGAAPGPLRVALLRRPDASIPGRMLASALMLVVVGGLLEARRRMPLVSRVAAIVASAWWAAPALAIGAGAAWIATLDPTWPGWLAIVGGIVSLAAWAPRSFLPRRDRPDRAPAARHLPTGDTDTVLVAGPVPSSPPSGPAAHPAPAVPRGPAAEGGSTARPAR